MILRINSDAVLQSVQSLLTADNTLNGSGYLERQGAIYRTKAPDKAETPYVVLTVDQLSQDTGFSGELRCYVYTRLLANGQIDPSLSPILNKCDELLSNAVPVLSGHGFQPLFGLGVVPFVYDPQDKSKGRGLCRYRLDVYING